MAKKLKAKWDAFVSYYLIEWNGAEAARLAGFSPRSARQIAAELLANPDIQAEIKSRLAELQMSADEVLTRLTDHARSSFADFLDENNNLDLTKAEQAGKLHLIKEFTVTERTFKGITDKTTTVKLYDAQAALMALARRHSLLTDRLKVTEVDWRDEAIETIRKGEVTYTALVEEFGSEEATGLFKRAGITIPESGEAETGETEESEADLDTLSGTTDGGL